MPKQMAAVLLQCIAPQFGTIPSYGTITNILDGGFT